MQAENLTPQWYTYPDNTPQRGTLCLCKVKHQPHAVTDYRIAFYGEMPHCICGNQFWFYDLLITNEVLAFMPLEHDYTYF